MKAASTVSPDTIRLELSLYPSLVPRHAVTLEYADIEELRKTLARVDYGTVELQVHAGAIIAITVATVNRRALRRKDRLDVYDPAAGRQEGGRTP